MKFHKIAFILLVIGGVNWGLVGVGNLMGSDWNLVSILLSSWPTVESLVYVLVGIAGVAEIFGHKGMCKECAA